MKISGKVLLSMDASPKNVNRLISIVKYGCQAISENKWVSIVKYGRQCNK